MKDGTQRQAETFVLVTGVLILGAVLFFFANPASSRLFWRCPFHAITGFDCPGCGTQRAIHALLHGNFKEAMFLNALAVFIIFPLALWAYIAFALNAFGIERIPRPPLTERTLLWLVILAILFGLLRNLPWPPFTWFF